MYKKYLFFCLSAILLFSSCEKTPEEVANLLNQALGWFGTDDPNVVPENVALGFGGGDLPSSHDLTSKFPPIGDQGEYGTCVAWAVGYNCKTALEAINRGYTPAQLASSQYQVSPKDLFKRIPTNKKGENCNGTDFTTAFDQLLNSGAATLQNAPYTNLGNCSGSSTATGAEEHKIKNYRRIDYTIDAIREQIANNVPVVFGAKLSDNFMSWRTSNVLSSNSSYNNVGQHAYHALTICAYDDNKGPNGAFKIANTWGKLNWGDNGFAWVDYNFFINEFCFAKNVYIATDDNGNTPPSNTDPPANHNGIDLSAWVFSDYSTSGNDREMEYNVYNIGNLATNTNNPWGIMYFYYNAYNADDYGIIFYDEFNTNVSAGTANCYYDDQQGMDVCDINININSNSSFASTLFGDTEDRLYQSYTMPQLNGSYYLVVYADATFVYDEADEDNNFFYSSGQDPINFVNGIGKTSNGTAINPNEYKFKNNQAMDLSKKSKFRTAVYEKNKNAYSLDEIKKMLLNKRNSGELKQKINNFKKNHQSIKGIYSK